MVIKINNIKKLHDAYKLYPFNEHKAAVATKLQLPTGVC